VAAFWRRFPIVFNTFCYYAFASRAEFSSQIEKTAAAQQTDRMNIAAHIISNVERVLLGKPDAVRLAVACFVAEGHLLIDDIPGVGKTTLALAMAKSIGGDFQRLQFTSDLLPSDILGVSVFNGRSQTFDFKAGPIFHNVILADEINRASPKTQSSLLEAMQERQVSIDNNTHPLPHPFFVIATQNPHEHHGTFPLPESQLDRFMMRLNLGYPAPETEQAILKGDLTVPRVNSLSAVVDNAGVMAALGQVRSIRVDDSLDRYLVEVAGATRQSPFIDLGLSPRGTLALRRAAQGLAYTDGRDFVTPDDIKRVAIPVMAHRIKVKGGSVNGYASRSADHFIREILDKIPVPA
jgi:MoxR-like ATPase